MTERKFFKRVSQLKGLGNMNFKEAEAIEQTITAKRFWMVMSNANGWHLHECKAEKHFGRWCHFKRFAGWKDSWGDRQAVRCKTAHKKWEGFWLAQQLTRTDWKVQVISNEVKILLTQRNNYHKLYSK